MSSFAVVIPIRALAGLPAAQRDHLLTLLNVTVESVCRSLPRVPTIYVVGSGNLESSHSGDPIRVLDLRSVAPETVDLVRGSPTSDAGYLDMHSKRLFGARAALAAGAGHVMFLDADDLAHRDVCAFVSSAAEEVSWLAECGFEYIHRFGRIVKRRSRFAARSGSSVIVSRTQLIDDFGVLEDSTSPHVLYHHSLTERVGRAGRSLPFPAFVYRTDHGGNFTLGLRTVWGAPPRVIANYLIRAVGKLVLSAPYSNELREAFGDPRTPNVARILFRETD